MLYGKYKFQCQLDTDAVLPPYKGSTFRGVFDNALKKVVCALKRQECASCLLKSTCVYALVFETHLADKPPGVPFISSPPPPFVIEPPLTIQTHFSQRSAFNFDLLLFGEVNNSLPYFIYAFEQMGGIGIGRRIAGLRGRFNLQLVEFRNRTIYSDKDKMLNVPSLFDSLSISDPNKFPKGYFRLKLSLDTPLRFKINNRFAMDLPFDSLVKVMLRRITTLISCYGNGNQSLDHKGLVARAKQIKIVEKDLKWVDWRRYSRRQEEALYFGGLAGSVIYEGRLGEYMPFVNFCSEVHLGKQTTFGLGKIRAELV